MFQVNNTYSYIMGAGIECKQKEHDNIFFVKISLTVKHEERLMTQDMI